MREKLLDKIVHGFSRFHEHHHAAGALELRDYFLDGMRANDLRSLRFFGEKFIHLRHRAIVNDDGKSVIVHVQNKILSHDGEADESDVSFRFHLQIEVKIVVASRYKSSTHAPEETLSDI